MKIEKKFILLEDLPDYEDKIFRITFTTTLEDYDSVRDRMRQWLDENEILKEEIEIEI